MTAARARTAAALGRHRQTDASMAVSVPPLVVTVRRTR